MTRYLLLLLLLPFTAADSFGQQNLRSHGVEIGVLPPGPLNAITDVEGVLVGHTTRVSGDSVHTGVTAILPHPGNLFQEKVPAAIHIGNGFGKLAGYSQVEELGTLETPVILTNTLGVPTASNAVITHMMELEGNERVRSINPVVGETNDGYLNDIRARHVTESDVREAIRTAAGGTVEQGNRGAGTGTITFGFKGGIGTSSRQLPGELGGYTVGVLVQSNFGGVLTVDGVPVGEQLGRYYLSDRLNETPDGSCMIVVATDAPLGARNLKRLAKRAIMGLARTGGIASNGSGDYVIAFSTASSVRVPYRSESSLQKREVLRNDSVSPLFMGVIEATEEAIINSLFHAETTDGYSGTVEQLPVEQVLEILQQYGKEIRDEK